MFLTASEEDQHFYFEDFPRFQQIFFDILLKIFLRLSEKKLKNL